MVEDPRSRPAHPRRRDARLTIELTEREARALVRATMLVADVLRPELFRDPAAASASPLVTGYQALLAACERHGLDLGLPPATPLDSGQAAGSA